VKHEQTQHVILPAERDTNTQNHKTNVVEKFKL